MKKTIAGLLAALYLFSCTSNEAADNKTASGKSGKQISKVSEQIMAEKVNKTDAEWRKRINVAASTPLTATA